MSLAHKFLSGRMLKNEKKNFVYVLLLLVLVGAGVAGYFAVNKFIGKGLRTKTSTPRIVSSEKIVPKSKTLRVPQQQAVPVKEFVTDKSSEKEHFKKETVTEAGVSKVKILSEFSKTPEVEGDKRKHEQLKEKVNNQEKKLKVVLKETPFLSKELKEVEIVEEATKSFKSGDISKAIRLYTEALKINPRNLKALLNLSAIYYQLGDAKRAKALLFRGLKYYPNNPDILNNLGVIYMQSGNLRKALEYFNKVLSRNPTDKAAIINKALCLKRLGREKEYVAELMKGARLYPEEYRFYMYLGIFYYEKGDVDSAYKFFTQAYEMAKRENAKEAEFLRKLLER